MGLEGLLPRVNVPSESGTYKIVQIEVDGAQFLRFGDGTADDRHALVLMRFLRDADARYETERLRSGQGPACSGERYSVQGMGRSVVNVGTKVASFHGESADYGVGVSAQALDAVREFTQGWDLCVAKKL